MVDSRRPGNDRFAAVILVLLAGMRLCTAAAQNATWDPTVLPGDSAWDNTGNWSTGVVPTGTATFAGLGQPTISLPRTIFSINILKFTAGPYSFTKNLGGTFNINGTGAPRG